MATSAERETAGRLSRLYAQQGLIYLLGSAVQRGLRIAILPVYTHLIGAAGYGVLQLLSIYGQLLGAVAQHGQHAAFVRLGFETESSRERARLQSTIVWHLLAVALVLALLLAAVGSPLAGWLSWGVPFWPFGALLVGQVLCSVFISLHDQQLAALQRAVDAVRLSLVRTLLMLLLVAALVVWLQLGVLGKLIADFATAALGAVIALRALAPGPLRDRSPALRRRALAYGLPLFPHVLAGLVNNLIDRVMVNAYLGLSAVGVYALAYQLLANGTFILTALNRSFAPAFVATAREATEMRARGELEPARERLAGLSLACLRFFAAGVLIFAALAGALKELVRLLAPEEFEAAWRIGPLLGAGMMAMALYYALNQAIFFDARGTRLLPLVTGSAAALNVVANAWLLPRYGLHGAALATLASNLLLPLGSFLGGRRVLRLPHQTRRWLSIGLLGLAYLLCVATLDRGDAAPLLSFASKLGLGLGLCWLFARIVEVSPLRLARQFLGSVAHSRE